MDTPTIQQQAADKAAVPRAVTLRSILLGVLGVLFICGLTPYNDNVVANTFLVGNFLPIGLLLFFLVFVLLVNAPLRRWLPRLAFGKGELGVALAMTLASCAIPSSGLMRYLPTELVMVWAKAGGNADYADVMKKADLPDYLFPKFERQGIEARANEQVIQHYVQRIPVDEDTFMAHFTAIPWSKWVVPAIVWGAFVAMVFVGMLCLSVIFRRQWVENERLPYPLAGVYLSVVEEPAPGKMFNSLFSSRGFWLTAGAIFVLHGINALNKYDPRTFPVIPVRYDFNSIFGNPPWSYTEYGFKSATLFFSMVGIVYYLQSNVAFSLWFFYVLGQVTRMFYGTYQAEFTGPMQQDQNLGAVLVFSATIIYIARHQLALVVRQMFARPKPGEPQGRYLPYSIAGWGFATCYLGMIVWLMITGVTFFGAFVSITMGGLLFLVIARIVAETGIMFVQLSAGLQRPWIVMAQSLPEGMAIKTSVKSVFFAGFLQGIFGDLRESICGFMPQTLRVADGAAYEDEKTSRHVLPFTLCLIGALVLGYLVAGTSKLYTEYTYASTQDRKQSSPMDSYAMDGCVNGQILDPAKSYIAQGGPNEGHNRWLHIGIGGGITAFASIMRLRFASWPLHPVGYLLAFTYTMQMIWFSIMIGWLLKVLVVKFGGASLYRSARPVFMGMIIGEVGAAAFWLVVSLVLNALNIQYNAINLLPT